MRQPRYSIIVPVFNRPKEVQEFLESVVVQGREDLEVIIVEDGSEILSEDIAYQYRDRLPVQYIFKPNSGPGPSRNLGFEHAEGDYFAVFDSDCILPSGYFNAVDKGLKEQGLDAWGGPDRAHDGFTLLQRAMGYTMSSVLTTGGIRGGKRRMGWFQPRSFNMGISHKVFEKTGGFKFDRYAEDIEFSIRMRNAGFRVGLIPGAFVYHKRRATFKEFYKQVKGFGKGRALVGRVHPSEVKLAHWFPALFTMATAAMILLAAVDRQLFFISFIIFLFYVLALFVHSWVVNRNFLVAVLSVPAALVQFFGYGLGFLKEKFLQKTG